jgi:hypothetical protein
MEFTQYVRRPFAVEAVEITMLNIEEIAKLIGELGVKDGVIHIALNRRIIPNVDRAFVGWFMTRMGNNYRCYSPKTFSHQFIDYQDSIEFVFDGSDEFEEDEEEPTDTEILEPETTSQE